MDSMPKKFYPIHEFDARRGFDQYFSDEQKLNFIDDSLKFPMMNLHYVFSKGYIHGNLLLDFSKGFYIHHLYSASMIFKDIILMKFNKTCAMEACKWLSDSTGAFDWIHTKTAIAELEEKSVQKPDKELNLKASIKQIVMCSLEKENLTDPLVLPLSDCIISVWLLDIISKDQEEYMRNLEKISNLLNIGGHLIIIGALNMTYFTAGECFFACKYDESFVRSALRKFGFVIDYCVVQKRRNVSDLSDYTHVIFITAQKEK
ncbi:nicotinamide N-methyltransferase-like [Pyxicephalus adspersus]|uniref:Nicotinamide N-methyltransferase-like protein n=1 Tax=Pyxicephalus adspersus TaxID=30357 RepID=A0AAV2ZGZ5_PYXAD|nr:TPA: hypothetical protein GDO54_003953 [Pyxicephalus adspersus]